MRRGSLAPVALQGIFAGWNRRVPHGIKIATFCDDEEVQEVFTSTNVRTRETVFPLFGDAGTRSATEAEFQEFGESVRVTKCCGDISGKNSGETEQSRHESARATPREIQIKQEDRKSLVNIPRIPQASCSRT